MDPAFTISCATEADIDAMAQVYYDAFALDSGNTWWWPPERDAMFEWMHGRIQRKLANRNVRHFRVLDDQKELVAWARWDIPEGYEAQFGEWAGYNGAVPDADGSHQAVPRGSDPEVCEYFFAKLVSLSNKWNADEMLGMVHLTLYTLMIPFSIFLAVYFTALPCTSSSSLPSLPRPRFPYQVVRLLYGNRLTLRITFCGHKAPWVSLY